MDFVWTLYGNTYAVHVTVALVGVATLNLALPAPPVTIGNTSTALTEEVYFVMRKVPDHQSERIMCNLVLFLTSRSFRILSCWRPFCRKLLVRHLDFNLTANVLFSYFNFDIISHCAFESLQIALFQTDVEVNLLLKETCVTLEVSSNCLMSNA